MFRMTLPGLEGTANPLRIFDDFASPACAFFIDCWIFDKRETLLSGTIKVGTVMMKARAPSFPNPCE